MWILWVGVLLCSASYTMAIPFLPLFLFDLGVDKSAVNLWAGIVHSSAFLVGAIMAPLWGSLADKYGKRKMVIRAGLSLAVIYALIAFVRNPWELVIVRMLHGFVGGFVPASMAIVASVSPKEKMGWSLGMMQAGTMTGGIVGPLFGGLLALYFGQRMSFVIAAVTIFIATIAVIVWVKEGTQGTAGKRTSIMEDFRVVLQSGTLTNLLLLLITFQLSFNMIQPLLTLHIAELQGDVKGAVLSSGIVFALIGIAGILASPMWGKAGVKRGYANVLAFCLITSGIVVSLQFFVYDLWLFTAVQFIFGLFMAGIVPTINTLVVQSTADEFRGRSFGLTTSANQLGAMIGPLVGGGLGFFLNIHWIFVTIGVLLVSAGLTVMLRRMDVQPCAGKHHA
ncbi:MFS transporter [Paenibacillus abyssi]|nr:MFS transporter [Paenibacillus abyssi]